MEEAAGMDSDMRLKGRKRLRYERLWVRRRRKLQKDAGSAYETYKGESRPAKQLLPITCRCKLRCAQKVTLQERKRIFNDFYKLKSHDAQNKYLYGLLHKQAVRRKVGSRPKRSVTYSYNLRLSEKEVQVCKKTFCDVHSVGKRRIEFLCEKLNAGELQVCDARGTQKNRYTIPNDVKEKVREHIRSFPRRQSHYSRGDNQSREYLPEGLSIAHMHRMYLSKNEPSVNDTYIVKEWLYRKIFNEEFNLGFGYPRSDTCQICDELKMGIATASSETQRSELNLKLAEHQLKASQAYQSLRNDTEMSKTDPDLHVITFDLQQNLPVPTLTHQSMFYLRQLWVYNFGIHVCDTGSAIMCIWNECIAGRGSSEIVSCLKQYFSSCQPSATRLVCYSDSCFGQNKNFTLICFWNTLILQNRFKQIDHKFLVRGHTYLPNDRDFSHIEKRKATAHVFVPQQWEEVIASARQKKPYRIQRMTSDQFHDFSVLEKVYTRRKKDTLGKNVLISKVTWMNFGQSTIEKNGQKIVEKHPNQVWLRYTYAQDEEWSKVSLLKGRSKSQPNIDVTLLCMYPNGHAINPKKIADLKKMIPFLPMEHRQFYLDLQNHPTNNDFPDTDYNDE